MGLPAEDEEAGLHQTTADTTAAASPCNALRTCCLQPTKGLTPVATEFAWLDDSWLSQCASPGKPLSSCRGLGRFSQRYRLGGVLGLGRSTAVRECTHIETGKKLAVKILAVSKSSADSSLETVAEVEKELDYIYQELELTAEVQGEEFVNLVEYFEEHDNGVSLLKIYLVLELLPGGDLMSEITRCGSVGEDSARGVVATLMGACRKMHARGIAHNDIKPENVLLRRCGQLEGAVLTDMGLAQYLAVGKVKPVCGTPAYVPPEVASSSPLGTAAPPLTSIAQGTAGDIWASGVVIYVLLCGSLPFGGNNLSELFEEIRNREVDFAERAWTTVSAEAKDFIRLCLTKDPLSRLTAEQALKHPWMTRAMPVASTVPYK